MDQRGVHLLEARTRNVLTTYEYESLMDYTPSLNHMLIITGTDKKQSKIIVNTNQVIQESVDMPTVMTDDVSGIPNVQLDTRVHGEDSGGAGESQVY